MKSAAAVLQGSDALASRFLPAPTPVAADLAVVVPDRC